MLEIYKADTEHKEYVEGLLELLSQEDMGKVANVLQMVLYEDGSIAVDTGRYSMAEMMLFKGHMELNIMRRYLLVNGCGAMSDEFREYADEDCEEETQE